MDDVAKIVMAGFNILLIISISCAELTGMSTVVIRDLKATVSTLNTVPCTLVLRRWESCPCTAVLIRAVDIRFKWPGYSTGFEICFVVFSGLFEILIFLFKM